MTIPGAFHREVKAEGAHVKHVRDPGAPKPGSGGRSVKTFLEITRDVGTNINWQHQVQQPTAKTRWSSKYIQRYDYTGDRDSGSSPGLQRSQNRADRTDVPFEQGGLLGIAEQHHVIFRREGSFQS